jgi:hypothetical protein
MAVELAATWGLNVGPGKYTESSFGKGAYGAAAYAQGGFQAATGLALMEALAGGEAITVGLAADLAFAPFDELAGELNIQPALVANLTTGAVELAGALSVNLNLGAGLSLAQGIAGAWSLSLAFIQAPMAMATTLRGAWTLSIAIPIPPDVDMTTGPLWAADALCPPPLWTNSTLCPAPPWRPESDWRPSLYGVGGYGVNFYGFGYPTAGYAPSIYGVGFFGAALYGLGQATPFVPSWTPSELCHA